MARSDRIDKKQLKEDPLLNFMARALDSVKANANLFIGGVLAVVIVVVLLVFWGRGRTERSFDSNIRAEAAVGAFAVGQHATALQMADGIIATYPGSHAAVLASYVSGQSNLQLGSFIAAEQGFRRYLDDNSKEPFYATSAQLGLAASLEGQRRFAEAAEMYTQTAALLPVSLANRARMDAARCWRLATSYSQAESLLQQVVNDGELLASKATIELAVVEALRNSSTRAAPSVTPAETTTPSSEVTP